jgi:hypothetical protein
VVLIAGVALVACCAALAQRGSPDPPYAALVRTCTHTQAEPYVSCLSGFVLQYAYEHPQAAGAVLSYIADHARDDDAGADLRPLSETAHYVGMELSARHLGLARALADCGYAFKAACMHGFVMERLDREPGLRSARGFLSFCQPVKDDTGYYENCLHGVGHELWARTRLSLSGALDMCDPVHSSADRSACWSGVLIESSKGGPRTGRHSHAPAGRRLLPCGSVAARFQEVCTYAQASYRQYVAGWESPRTTYARCLAAPQAERLTCATLVSERLRMARAGDRLPRPRRSSTLGGCCR